MTRVQLPLAAGSGSGAKADIDIAALQARLSESVKGDVLFDRLSRALYSTDASVYQIMPLGVVIPKDENDIIATMRACLEFGVPLTPRGAGTSQAGQAVGAGVQLDCSKFFDRVLQIDAEERWVRVQPGCVLDDLNSQLRPLGLHFAPDVSTSNRATIGGMIGNNSCRAHSIIYGKTVDHVMELKVVLASGEVAELRAMDAVELKRRSLQPGLEGDCYRTVQRIVTEYADEIVRRVCATAGFEEEEQHKISMAVHESMINAIWHGNKSDASKYVWLRFDMYSDRLEIHIRDQGTGFDVSKVPDPLASENLLKVSGRGIFLIRSFMDDFRVESLPGSGTEVILVKRIDSTDNSNQGGTDREHEGHNTPS